MTFIERLESMGFIQGQEGSYENYINGNSVFVTLFDNGTIGINVYNDETEEELDVEYKSSAPIMRIINRLSK